jgi:hypothetical protein
MTRSRSMPLMLVAVTATVLASISGCAKPADEPPRGAANMFAVGDCVKIPAADPAAPGTLHATNVSCAVDPSYTVGAVADAAGSCPSPEYQHLPGELADASTAKLCLVPNLVADHCYELGVPVGVLALANCAQRGQNGLLVQITKRLDVRDQQACPSDGGHYAWPYPSPARTYCTLTIF